MLSEFTLQRAKALKLYGIISHVNEINDEEEAFLQNMMTWEEQYRSQSSLDGRLRKARTGRYKKRISVFNCISCCQ